jgi:hypothetical protein
MNTVFVVVVVALVVIVVTAAGLLLRSIASSKADYRRNLEDIRQIRDDIRNDAPDDAAVIRVNRDDWLGTSDHLG